jgi:hypothetical protein
MRIYCPKCHWEPTFFSTWFCDDICNHEWNTFDTYGQCPKCGKIWMETQCLECDIFSLHMDWYHELDDTLIHLAEDLINLNVR